MAFAFMIETMFLFPGLMWKRGSNSDCNLNHRVYYKAVIDNFSDTGTQVQAGLLKTILETA